MAVDSEMLIGQKAAMYDLLQILKKNRKNQSSETEKEFSYQDLVEMFAAYIDGQKI